jgi:hypothetical protein
MQVVSNMTNGPLVEGGSALVSFGHNKRAGNPASSAPTSIIGRQ